MAYNFQTTCWEIDGSPVEAASYDSFRATVSLRCAWGDRYNLAGEISQYLLYPNAPATLARARTITVAPFTKVNNVQASQNASYEDALVVTEYVWDRKTPQSNGADLFSETLEPTAEFLTLDYTQFTWQSGDPLTEGEAPGMLQRGLDYVLTHHDLQAVPPAALSLIGAVNDAPVTSYTLGLSFDTGTLLFNPPCCQRRVAVGPNPMLTWTVTYRLTYKPQGWNYFWRTKTQQFEQLCVQSSGAVYNQYPLAPFTGL